MAQKHLQLHLPIARLVYGSLYDFENDDTKRYGVTLAIPKSTEPDWRLTPWGMQIVDFAKSVFVNRETEMSAFSWKVFDGDQNTPNKGGSIPAKFPGWAGHWIMKSTSMVPTKVLTTDGSRVIPEKDVVKCGDYLECIAIFTRNFPPKNDPKSYTPGLYCFVSHAAFSARGEEIQRTPMVDVSNEQFGKQALPAGAAPVTDVQGVPIGMHTQRGVDPVPTPAPAAMPAPHTGILSAPPAPPVVPTSAPAPAPVRKMTGKATTTYEAYIAANWTDELLIQHGIMTIE